MIISVSAATATAHSTPTDSTASNPSSSAVMDSVTNAAVVNSMVNSMMNSSMMNAVMAMVSDTSVYIDVSMMKISVHDHNAAMAAIVSRSVTSDCHAKKQACSCSHCETASTVTISIPAVTSVAIACVSWILLHYYSGLSYLLRLLHQHHILLSLWLHAIHVHRLLLFDVLDGLLCVLLLHLSRYHRLHVWLVLLLQLHILRIIHDWVLRLLLHELVTLRILLLRIYKLGLLILGLLHKLRLLSKLLLR